jgi:hypothetical protein
MAKRRLWTRPDIKLLRSLAGKKSAKAIGRALKRSESAVRFKAHATGVSLALK